jgi:hypothetical protein
MSYARFNDVHDDGQLTALRQRLAAEVRVQTGREFVIFQDPGRYRVGAELGGTDRGDTLDVVTLLVAVITPGFFESAA